MSVFKQWSEALAQRNPEDLVACLHEDFVFVRHQTGTTMNKATMSEMLHAFMASDSVIVRSQRCLYENESVCVEHTLMDFSDGTREAILSFHRIQDGQIIHTETGATPVAVE